jgi:hypothetical protein
MNLVLQEWKVFVKVFSPSTCICLVGPSVEAEKVLMHQHVVFDFMSSLFAVTEEWMGHVGGL